MSTPPFYQEKSFWIMLGGLLAPALVFLAFAVVWIAAETSGSGIDRAIGVVIVVAVLGLGFVGLEVLLAVLAAGLGWLALRRGAFAAARGAFAAAFLHGGIVLAIVVSALLASLGRSASDEAEILRPPSRSEPAPGMGTPPAP